MKKLLTGVVCAAAIVAAAVVLLPVAAVRIAVRLSKPRDLQKQSDARAEGKSSGGFLTEDFSKQGQLGVPASGEK